MNQLSLEHHRPGAVAPVIDEEFVARFDQRIPRYTSYPTAPQFAAEIGADTYAGWLEALPADVPLSVYLHVPFCAELCLYCGCHTTVARHYEPIASYVDLIDRELAVVVGHLGSRRQLAHLHWGGGTPTALRPQDLVGLTERLVSRFDVIGTAEIAVEIDPRRVSLEHVHALAAMGTTRVSLGIQDFDPKVQQAVRRIQSFDQTARVVTWLRDAGITALNFDLMYGLPYQNPDSMARSARLAVSLDPERIALFGYAHVPWMKRHQALLPADALPDARGRLEQMRAAAEIIVASGYVAVGLDHFAKPGDPLARRRATGELRRNFQGYTTDAASALIGLGTSAIGMLPEGYVQNAALTVAYREAITAGRLATVRGVRLSDDDRLRRAIIERLMCDLAVDLDRVAAEHGASPERFRVELERIDMLSKHGLVWREQGRIVVPEAARPFLRSICAVFDRYLERAPARYSRAL